MEENTTCTFLQKSAKQATDIYRCRSTYYRQTNRQTNACYFCTGTAGAPKTYQIYVFQGLKTFDMVLAGFAVSAATKTVTAAEQQQEE